jgi:hypothetical protein
MAAMRQFESGSGASFTFTDTESLLAPQRRRTRSDHRYPFLNFIQQRMQWKYDFYLGLRQYVEETWNQADIEANTHAPRSKHQAEVYRPQDDDLRQRPGSTRREAAGVLGACHGQTVLRLE